MRFEYAFVLVLEFGRGRLGTWDCFDNCVESRI